MEPHFNRFGIPVYDVATASDIDPWNAEEAVKSALPLLDSNQKTDYLGYRACGFSIREASAMAGVGQRAVMRWRRSDAVFRQWEEQGLHELQHSVSDTILRHQFMRNMHLVLRADGEALKKKNFSPHTMSQEDKDWAQDAAKRYKSQDLAMMLKALSPEAATDTGGVSLHIHLNEGQQAAATDERAAVKQLLDKFTINRREVIEGELVDDADSAS